MEISKELLVDAICGKGFKSQEFATSMTEVGLATYIGNQWNEKWEWNKKELKELPFSALEDLYFEINIDEEIWINELIKLEQRTTDAM